MKLRARAIARFCCPAAVIAAVCTATLPALAQSGIRVLVSELEAAPTALPTDPPSLVEALLQSKVSVSRNGEYWVCEVFNGNTAVGQTSDAVIWGNRSGVLKGVSRNQVIPGLGLSFEAGTWGIDTRQLINDRGDVSISGSVNGANTNDEIIIRYRSATNDFQITAREGDLIPGLGGERFGSDFEQRTFLSDGRIAFSNLSSVGSLAAFADDFIFLSDPAFAVVYQAGTVPPGQVASPGLDVNLLGTSFATNDDGTQWIAIGSLNRTTDRKVVILNGTVVLEQGQAIPGPAGQFSTALNIDDVTMGPAGHWAAYGRAASTGALWLVANGQRVFSAETPFPGAFSGEQPVQFVGMNFTTRGDLCFALQTSLGRGVVVVQPADGSMPIIAAESGTPVDLNGNGNADDDGVIVTSFFSASLADDGSLYLITRNSGPQSQFQFDVLGWLDLTPCRADINANSVLEPQDIFDFLNAWFEALPIADFNGIDGLTAQDIFDFLNAWFGGCA